MTGVAGADSRISSLVTWSLGDDSLFQEPANGLSSGIFIVRSSELFVDSLPLEGAVASFEVSDIEEPVVFTSGDELVFGGLGTQSVVEPFEDFGGGDFIQGRAGLATSGLAG